MAASTSIAPLLDAALMHEKRSSTADRVAADTAARNSEIRIVHPSEYQEAALCLAHAFREDHVVRYAIDTPDRAHWSEEEKFKLFCQMMEYVTYASCLKGLVTTVGPDYDCVALWNPPGKVMDDWVTVLRSGLWRLFYQFSSQGRQRFFGEFLPLLSRSLVDVLGERSADCWYLNYIGTKPGSRGRGYARKLIEHVTATADRDGKVCYLESSHEVNLLIYGKLGFQLQKKIYLEQDKEPHCIDIMIREPAQQTHEQT